MTVLQTILAAERRRQRGRLALAALCAATTAGATVLLLGVSGWFITGAAMAGASGAAALFNYLLPSACIRLLAISRTGCRYVERMSGHDAALRALARVRPALFAALSAEPPAAALALSTGEAVARMTQDVDEVEAGFVRRSSRWAAGAAVLAGGALLVPAGAAAAVAGLLTVAALWAVARWIAGRHASIGPAVAATGGSLKQEVATMLAAASELRAYGLEDWAADRIAERSQTLVAAQQRAASGAAWLDPALAAAGGLAVMLTLTLSHAASLPHVALAAFGAFAMVEGVTTYLRSLQRAGHLDAAERRLDAMLGSQGVTDVGQQTPTGAPDITMSGLAAGWAAGSVIGLTGPSGCGKTTLLETLVGLREVRPGMFRVTGVDMADLSLAHRRALFSLAPQDASLIAGTVRENLTLANPAATEADLWQALHDAALDERVASLPGGLDCWIGEGGSGLSGGERRRLSVARALLRKAPWLLLDEPTEGLDAVTEARVVDGLKRRLAATGQGAILVSHRRPPLAICSIVALLQPPHPRPVTGERSTTN